MECHIGSNGKSHISASCIGKKATPSTEAKVSCLPWTPRHFHLETNVPRLSWSSMRSYSISSGNRISRSRRGVLAPDTSMRFTGVARIGRAPVMTIGPLAGLDTASPFRSPASHPPIKGILRRRSIKCASSLRFSLTTRLRVLGARYPSFPSGILSP